MSELVDFLTARLDEDEAVARAAFVQDRDDEGDPNWRAHRQKSLIPGHIARWQVVSVAESWEDPGFPAERVAELMIGGGDEEERPTAEFIARHDPARVLREVTAKRTILTLHQPHQVEWVDAEGDDRDAVVCSECDPGTTYPCDTVRALAATFSDHPDFQEQWR